MSTDANGNPVPETPPPSPAPGASTPASGTPPAEWRAGPESPEWARGKTGPELLAISARLADELSRPAAPPPPQNAPIQVTDDDFIRNPLAAAQMVADQRMAAAMDPMQKAMQGFAVSNAAIQRSLAAQQYPDVFSKWGAEVDEAMKNVAVELRTLDNYEKVVTYVRGKHTDEIAMERAKAMLAGGGLGERSTGANGLAIQGVGFDIAKLRPDQQELMKKHGIGIQEIESFCKANGWPTQKWFDEAQNGNLFTQNSPFEFQIREDKLGATRQFA